MCNKKIIVSVIALFMLSIGVFTASAAGLIDQKAVLSGKVVSIVQEGAYVQEGAELARVSTLAGSATAARATVKGVVQAVLVQPGSMVQSGDVIVKVAAE